MRNVGYNDAARFNFNNRNDDLVPGNVASNFGFNYSENVVFLRLQFWTKQEEQLTLATASNIVIVDPWNGVTTTLDKALHYNKVPVVSWRMYTP